MIPKASDILNAISTPNKNSEKSQTISSFSDDLSAKRMVTLQKLAEVEDDVNGIEEYDDTE